MDGHAHPYATILRPCVTFFSAGLQVGGQGQQLWSVKHLGRSRNAKNLINAKKVKYNGMKDQKIFKMAPCWLS